MRRPRNNQSGYSMAEILTVVAIAGLIAVVCIPALMQVLPQYRMRASAGELSSAMRLTRQNAMSTRRAWRITIDSTGTRYAVSMLSSPTASVKVSSNWTKIGENFRPITGGAPWWKKLQAMEISSTGFLDVDCTDGKDIIFKRDGSVDPTFNNGCADGGSAAIDFTTEPKVRMHVNTNLVPFNTYYLSVNSSGYITASQTKE